MDIWHLFSLSPFATAILLWLLAPLLVLAIPALLIVAFKKHARQRPITYIAVFKALIISAIVQLLLFAILNALLPAVWPANSAYTSLAICFFVSQFVGSVLMIYLLVHYHAITAAAETSI